MLPEITERAKFACARGFKLEHLTEQKRANKLTNMVRNTIDRLSEPNLNTPVKRGKGKMKNKGKKVEVASK